MKIDIFSKEVHLNDSIRNCIEKEINKLNKRFKKEAYYKVTIKQTETKEIKVSIIVYCGKYMFKGDNIDKSALSAIINATKEVEKRINKNKTKIMNSRNIKENLSDNYVENIDLEKDENIQESTQENVKSTYDIGIPKQIILQPLSIQDAILQLNLLDHDFFVFINEETNKTNIIYKNKKSEDSYGLIDLKR